MKRNYKSLNKNGIRLIYNYKSILKRHKKIWNSRCNKLPILDRKLIIIKEGKHKNLRRYRLINKLISKYNFKILINLLKFV